MLVHHSGATFGQDISNELHSKTTITLTEPTYSEAVLERHEQRVEMIEESRRNLRRARLLQLNALEESESEDRFIKIADINNDLLKAEFEAQQDIPIEMTDAEKTAYENEWRTYRERKAQLIKHRGQAFSLILGQCTQTLQEKMKQDLDWPTVETSFDPLLLY